MRLRLLVCLALWQGARSPLRINEVADKGNASDAGCAGSDWVELRNPTASVVLLSGLVLSDDHGVPYSKSLALGGAGCPDALGGGELLLLCKDGHASVGGTSYAGCGFEFGIGGSDAVGLYQYNGAVGGEAAVLVDVTTGCCSGDSTTSFGRPAGGSVTGNGSFAVLPARTPGLPNPSPPPPESPTPPSPAPPSPPPPPLDSHPAETCSQQTKQKAIYATFEHSPAFLGATDVIGDTLWCATHCPRLGYRGSNSRALRVNGATGRA